MIDLDIIIEPKKTIQESENIQADPERLHQGRYVLCAQFHNPDFEYWTWIYWGSFTNIACEVNPEYDNPLLQDFQPIPF